MKTPPILFALLCAAWLPAQPAGDCPDDNAVLDHVYRLRIECGGDVRFAYAFRLRGETGLFTVLHAVAGCWDDGARAATANKIEARNARPGAAVVSSVELRPDRINLDYDFVQLKTNGPAVAGGLEPAPGGLTGTDVQMPVFPPTEITTFGRAFMRRGIGLLARLDLNQSTRLSHLGFEEGFFSKRRGDADGARSSPVASAHVLVLDAGVGPGHSGAPILSPCNQVMGVVGGGLFESVNVQLPEGAIRWLAQDGMKVDVSYGMNFAYLFQKAFDDLEPSAAVLRDKRASATIDTIATLSDRQMFFQNAREFRKGVEFVYVARPKSGDGSALLVMAAEATAREWLECSLSGRGASSGESGCSADQELTPSRSDFPARIESAEEAHELCRWIDPNARLPTVGEWRRFAGSLPDECNVNLQTSSDHCKSESRAQPVRSFAPNDQEIYDAYGNMWEWACEGAAPTGTNDAEEVCPPSSTPTRVGGSFLTPYRLADKTKDSLGPLERRRAAKHTTGARCVIPL